MNPSKPRLLMMSCREATDLVSASLDRPLSIHERFMMRAHLLFCRACNEYSRQIGILEKILRLRRDERIDLQENGEIGLTEESREKILRSIRDEMRNRESGGPS